MNKDNDKEAIRSEEERVASFMQALQRMHDNPAEAARIDSMIEDADIVAQQTPDRNPPQHVVVNVNGGEHNTVEIFGSRHDAPSDSHSAPEPASPEMPEHPHERSNPVPEVQITRTRALTATAALALMTTIAIIAIAMLGGAASLSAVLSIGAAATAGLHVMLMSDNRGAVRKLLMRSLQETPRELDHH